MISPLIEFPFHVVVGKKTLQLRITPKSCLLYHFILERFDASYFYPILIQQHVSIAQTLAKTRCIAITITNTEVKYH